VAAKLSGDSSLIVKLLLKHVRSTTGRNEMGNVNVDISMSLDGFVAGPNRTLDTPLGEGGELLHEWILATKGWRELHGQSGGESNPNDEVVRESSDRTGATVMGRRMYSGGEGGWEDDPKADGWWGDDPPFHHPVFVLTHHPREPVAKEGGTTFTFVTVGIEDAVEQATAAAGEKDVLIAGGASAIQQYVRAGLVDEIQLHVVPVLLGGGVRLFDGLGGDIKLETTRVIEAPGVTHVRLRVAR
jgi:dihydrofolate reductase